MQSPEGPLIVYTILVVLLGLFLTAAIPNP